MDYYTPKLLSVITINLNNREGLDTTINSIVTQTAFSNVEYIVIDGGSNDGSVDVIKQYDNYITYWVSEPDKGIYNAMNKAIDKATAPYTIFINSGDYLFENNTLQDIIPLLKQDIVYGDLCIHKTNGKTFHKQYIDNIPVDYFTYEAIPHEAAFVRTQLYKQYRFNEEYSVIADQVFFHQTIIRDKHTYKHVDNIITHFMLGGVSSDAEQVKTQRNKYFNQ